MLRFKMLLLLFAAAGCSVQEDQKAGNQKSGMTQEVQAQNLNIPWQIEFHNKDSYLSERRGSITKVNVNGQKSSVSLSLKKRVLHEGEGGFLGFTFSPTVKHDQTAYAYYTYKENGKTMNRIVSLKMQGLKWEEHRVLLEKIPGGMIHNGGRIKFGPDGKLYATTGDTGNTNLPQEKESLAGKILRMNKDGSIPADNPFSHSYVYSYGHRNPQGVAWDQKTMYSSEHGSTQYDEINLIQAGKNYGWPIIRGDETHKGMEKPILHSGEDTWAPSGLTYYKKKLYIASLRGEKVFSFDLKHKTISTIVDNDGRIRDIQLHNNNKKLYYITNNTDGRGTPEKYVDRLVSVGRFN